MPTLIEKASEVMKEQNGEVKAVLSGKDCDLSCNLDLFIVASVATLACFMSFLSEPFLYRCCLREPRRGRFRTSCS